MQFEVGQKWRCRNGDMVEIINLLGSNSHFPIIGTHISPKDTPTCRTFTDTGKHASHTENFPLDLIEQIIEPKFAVGQVWECHDPSQGLRRIVEIHAGHMDIVDARPGRWQGRSRRSLEGIWDTLDKSCDLVKLVIEKPAEAEVLVVTSDNDCECRMKKYGFTGHMQYCPDFQTMAQMTAMAVEVPVNPNALYRTHSDGHLRASEEDLRSLRKLATEDYRGSGMKGLRAWGK